MSVQFQPHSQYSVDQARIWRTDRLKGQEEEIEQEPGAPIVQPRFFDSKPICTGSASSSSSSSSSASTISAEGSPSIAVPVDVLTEIRSTLLTISNDVRDIRRINSIQSRQIENFVTMSCPDKFLSMVVCGYMKGVRDRNLTDADRQFLASERAREVQDDIRK